MKAEVKRFRSLSIGLKQLEPFIRDGEQLQTGKPFKNFGALLPREAVANWLICAVGNFAVKADRYTFSNDPEGGDGIIYDARNNLPYPTEHVMVPRQAGGKDAHTLILGAIQQKQNKGGAAYARGKELIVFLNAEAGIWYPNRIAKQLPKPLDFSGVWIVGLHEKPSGADEYVYNVSHINLSEGKAPIWRVRIHHDFETWDVEQVQ